MPFQLNCQDHSLSIVKPAAFVECLAISVNSNGLAMIAQNARAGNGTEDRGGGWGWE
jgi:hypothetical protein